MNDSILLVDDDAVQAATRQAVLARAGEKVFVVRSAHEAIERLRTAEWCNAVGLVITDHLMPGMNGPEFVAIVRGLLPALPILVLSGFIDAESLYAQHDVIFRVKPFPPDKLIALAHALLANAHRRTA